MVIIEPSKLKIRIDISESAILQMYTVTIWAIKQKNFLSSSKYSFSDIKLSKARNRIISIIILNHL